MAQKFIQVVFNRPVAGAFSYLAPEAAPAELGYRVVAPFGPQQLTGWVIETTETPPQGDFQIKAPIKVVDSEPFFGPDSVDLAKWIAMTSFCSWGEALACVLPTAKREGKTEWAETEECADYRPQQLSEEQKKALEAIVSGAEDYFYLFGVTGSGKTEVFLRAAEQVIQSGKSVLYLVPEISLTHQLLREVGKRFRGKLAVWHSALTPSRRLTEWKRIRSGEARLIIGARSAVLTPVQSLGLIIIDEEHDASYKSGETPRYHARQVAMHRCRQTGAHLVMGSATPGVEAWHLMQTGRLRRLNLTQRLAGGALPSVTCINMMKESGVLSEALREKILEVYRQGKQTLLFLNRRGFHYFFHCKSCGYEMRCERCSVSLTYYKAQNKMKCHYCGYSRSPITVCPECGSLDVGYSGFGTERVEEEVRNLFPQMKIARIDSDSVGKKGELPRLLKAFREGEYDLLLGTQMVAKGLNFPGVKLVGIVSADTSLHLPDFRSAERTFSLITQVAGRAGRYSPDGMVYVQSYHPEAPAIALACRGETEAFYQEELRLRQLLNFPPFCRVARLVFRGKSAPTVEDFAKKVLSALLALETVPVMGPAECPIPVINKNYRMQLLIRSPRFKAIHFAVSQIQPMLLQEHRVYVEIDMDPVSLL